MCELSSKDLYLALIDDINEYTGKIKNEEIENKENCSKLEHAISVLYNLKTGKNVKIYLRKLLDILNNIKYQFDEVKIFTECSDDDFYLSYGVLCAIFCIFKQDKSDGTFEIFDGFASTIRSQSIEGICNPQTRMPSPTHIKGVREKCSAADLKQRPVCFPSAHATSFP